MNYSLEVLTSDKFAEFSQKVAQLAKRKKTLKEEFKKLYDKFNQDTKNLDQEILSEQNAFELWRKEFETNVGDG